MEGRRMTTRSSRRAAPAPVSPLKQAVKATVKRSTRKVLADKTNATPVVEVVVPSKSPMKAAASTPRRKRVVSEEQVPGTPVAQGEELLRSLVQSNLSITETSIEGASLSTETQTPQFGVPHQPSPVKSEVTRLSPPSPVKSEVTRLLSPSPVESEVTMVSPDVPSPSPVKSEVTMVSPDVPSSVKSEVTMVSSDVPSPVKSEVTMVSPDVPSPVKSEVTMVSSDVSSPSPVARFSSEWVGRDVDEVTEVGDGNDSDCSVVVNVSSPGLLYSAASPAPALNPPTTPQTADFKWQRRDSLKVKEAVVGECGFNYYEDECEDYDEYDGEDQFGQVVDCDEICQGISRIQVADHGLPEHKGRHTRFNYNSDDELDVEEVDVMRLRGLPTPMGKHLRFPEDKDVDE